MITKLILKNFKSIKEQSYDFTQLDLLVGRNNSGKSTVLQALAIWQFCVDEFHRSKRTGSKGIQIVLPNFTALPVPEFNLLWKDRTDRHWPLIEGKKKQEYILIGICVHWRDKKSGETDSFSVELRYHSPQTIYAIPTGGWATFREYEDQGNLPVIAYVPPFSGLEPTEKRLDDGPVRQQIGKGQPGSILRNTLLRVCPSPKLMATGQPVKGYVPSKDWLELASMVKRWFSIELEAPRYEDGKDVFITVEYKQKNKKYDIISGGSGFHQTLTLLAFLYGYHPTTILLDEPDAHLHVNLQREILDFFKRKANERGTQFLIATHAEELIRGVDTSQIVSLLQKKPTRIESTPEIVRAMAEVSNEEITSLLSSPFILYVEGESDERILRAWAEHCGAQNAMDKMVFKVMSGGSKKEMKKLSDEHFSALKQIVPHAKKMILFNYDRDQDAFHPLKDNMGLVEWKRKNIENYLLVPEAWRRATLKIMGYAENNLLTNNTFKLIDSFFSDQNLTLPKGKTWKNVGANIFKVLDGKRILFEDDDSLFHQLRNGNPSVQLIREEIALNMLPSEIHQDVHEFIKKLVLLSGDQGGSFF